MNRAASAAIRDVDVVVFVVDRTARTDEDDGADHPGGGSRCVLRSTRWTCWKTRQPCCRTCRPPQSGRRCAILLRYRLRKHNAGGAGGKEILQVPAAGGLFSRRTRSLTRSQRFLAAEIVRENPCAAG